MGKYYNAFDAMIDEIPENYIDLKNIYEMLKNNEYSKLINKEELLKITKKLEGKINNCKDKNDYDTVMNLLKDKDLPNETINELETKLNNNKAKVLIEFIKSIKPFKELSFTLYEPVKAAARPRKTTRYGKVFFYDPSSKNKNALKKIIKEFLPKNWNAVEGEIEIEIISYRKIINKFNFLDKTLALLGFINPISRPDVDNIAKQLMDTMNKLVYKDDSQITKLVIKKKYSYESRTDVIIKYRDEPITTTISKK